METIGLIFVATKVLDGARVLQRVNVIVLTLTESVQLMMIFLGGLITFNIALTPLAQAIWGTYLIGYKTKLDTINSVFMIAYSKGDLQEILNINFTWSFNFIIIYYSMVIFVLHAAFHNVQTDALKNVVLLYSLQEDDVVQKQEGPVVEISPARMAAEKKKNALASVVGAVQWLFGWLPRAQIKMIGQLNELIPEYRSDEDDEEEGDEEEEIE